MLNSNYDYDARSSTYEVRRCQGQGSIMFLYFIFYNIIGVDVYKL